MSDNYASLGPSLLARKGGAKPAMRRQVGILPGSGTAAQNLEDLGWNDMGDDLEDEASSGYHRPADVLQLSPATGCSDDETPESDESSDGSEQDPSASILAKKPSVLRQQEEIASRMEAASSPALTAARQPVAARPAVEARAEPEPAPPRAVDTARIIRSERKRKPALDRGKRAAFTLRLDAQRHLKLRLACTLRNRSAQQLVTEALDEFLGTMNDVDTLAAQIRGAD